MNLISAKFKALGQIQEENAQKERRNPDYNVLPNKKQHDVFSCLMFEFNSITRKPHINLELW